MPNADVELVVVCADPVQAARVHRGAVSDAQGSADAGAVVPVVVRHRLAEHGSRRRGKRIFAASSALLLVVIADSLNRWHRGAMASKSWMASLEHTFASRCVRCHCISAALVLIAFHQCAGRRHGLDPRHAQSGWQAFVPPLLRSAVRRAPAITREGITSTLWIVKPSVISGAHGFLLQLIGIQEADGSADRA